jgi:hypothetical protein
MGLWPVYLPDVMQQDTPMLFELGDIVSWPVCLIDAGAPRSGWPDDASVSTVVSLQAGPYPSRRLAVTPEFAVSWSGEEPLGSQLRIAAALEADFFNPPFRTYLTGVVCQIAIASSPSAFGQDDHGGRWIPDGVWDLRKVRVAPLAFEHDDRGEPSGRREHGLLVHLEVITPRCRCQEIKQIQGEQALSYARRHLYETGGQPAAGITDYLCRMTGSTWRLDHPELPGNWRATRLTQLTDDQPSH